MTNGHALFTKVVVAAEILIVCFWSGSILILADGLSGPFSLYQWASMTALWVGIPLAIIGAFFGFGIVFANRGRATLALTLIAAPLALLAVAAIWAWFAG